MKETISIQLFNTLQKGKKKLGEEALHRMMGFVMSQRTEEDSFMNKNGKADLYYTLFGWMLSYVLGIRLRPDKMAAYLDKQDVQAMDLIHYASYMRCRLICHLMKVGAFRLIVRGLPRVEIKSLDQFTHVPHTDPDAPYSQYIWLSLLEDTGHAVAHKEAVLQTLTRYQVDGGGYSNLTKATEATTNATVAALAVKGQLEKCGQDAALSYLKQLQEDTGGFRAVKGSPLPDLLSTATSLFMLQCYDVTPAYPADSFIEAHWQDTGGFSATLIEESCDVEYTFYGLLALGTI